MTSRRKRGGPAPILALVALAGLMAAAVFWSGVLVGRATKDRTADASTEAATRSSRSPDRPAAVPRKSPGPRVRPGLAAPEGGVAQAPPRGARRAPRVALVIDDLGRSLDDVAALAELGVPIAHAVLPFESRTPQVVERLRASNAEILCHLPLEGGPAKNPGPGALWVGQPAEELTRLAALALDAVPGATGVNNHMGSALTADPTAMRAILGVVAGRRLFFLDSRTSAESVGFSTARELGVPALERQVFLDNDPAQAAIEGQFDRWLEAAERNGVAIAIGHPRPATLEVLRRRVPRALAEGYRFVTLRSLLRQDAPAPARSASGG